MPHNPFPPIITDLPEADIPFEGLDAYLLQGEHQQVIFMAFEREAEVPEHSHEAQWAVVLDGEIELTVGGETHVYRRGDTYYIPKGAVHRAKVRAGYKDVTLFNQRDRYKTKIG
jgi:quercetin dioxygenase-like cupin family protein